MSEPTKLPKFTSEQREFVMDRLSRDVPYAEIVDDFKRMYSYFCEPFSDDVLDKCLRERLRTLKNKNKDELLQMSEEGSQPLIPITNPYYRLQYLDKMLHDTPDIEVVAYDGNGNPKKKSNRADKLKMFEMAERIFEKMLGIDDEQVRQEMPKMVSSEVLGPPPEQSNQGVVDANS